MLIRRPSDIRPSEITRQDVYLRRREFIRAAGIGLAGAAIGAGGLMRARDSEGATKFASVQKSSFSTDEKMNSLKEISNYNNYYEFGTDKSDPARYAGSLKTRPWTVTVEGMVQKPRSFSIDEILKLAPLEERIYRLRCVEAWSMVIPWVGFPVSALLKQVEPLGSAKFVEFVTLADPAQMPGVRAPILDWPYLEGLRLDEAMHPLSIFAVGVYGEELPNQNGAPLRLVVPWKYGFKSGKSIVRIRLTDKMPNTAWMKANLREYGFYSNVNPEVDHPRWTQATERRIGEFTKRKTIMFNGYADQVASLYAGMDLRKFY